MKSVDYDQCSTSVTTILHPFVVEDSLSRDSIGELHSSSAVHTVHAMAAQNNQGYSKVGEHLFNPEVTGVDSMRAANPRVDPSVLWIINCTKTTKNVV